ncbi:FAD-binding oxidoreductase [Deinococcus cellulosilyticus]|uniref:FAD-binding oxidoreductase n=1 Tax=Deinococcus cellulosilyticus (strain DSM 18568 / NBRC 106333 / KACC 11606 / 5516J-15) TaxID=1223518 RepID=A0A511N0F7_DEIC1|nr:FAD-binding oxidoreductase [Deinococcus cellulosilyticus]GEM46380.1 FAD-binding oxidoreductase [Deinococcus cellulosilyticus NBRC 106333 = KACC 11606]
MKRWNGWGNIQTENPPSAHTLEFLQQVLGPGTSQQSLSFEEACAKVPDSRLTESPLWDTRRETRVRYARGQSLPDLIATRTGLELHFPDGVAFPQSTEEVETLVQEALQNGWTLIPYGGGTSVAGHINPPMQEKPVLTVSLERMNRLLSVDTESHLARFQAGVRGVDLEAQLRAHGFTLGHFPQSFEYSTLGGWIVTRSSGQQSLRYGRIEQLFAGGLAVTPQGRWELPPLPASAAGMDLRQLLLGSEGRLGILTEATVRITPLPEQEVFHAAFLPDWQQAMQCVRELVQKRIPLSMLRLSTPRETEANLIMAGKPRAVQALKKLLSVKGIGDFRCMLLYGMTGTKPEVRHLKGQVQRVLQKHGGMDTGTLLGKGWQHNRFRAPYLRNHLWEHGHAIDTLETCTTWERLEDTRLGIEEALQNALRDENEKVFAFTHLSHLYPSGSSLYTTYAFRIDPDPEVTLQRWKKLKSAASRAIVQHGATISHQHGVGRDHAPYLPPEKGNIGMKLMHTVVDHLDPQRIFPEGVLLPEEV